MTVPEMVHQQALLAPGRVALRHGSQVWTYGELDRQVGAFAGALRDLHCASGMTVGLCLQRSIQWVVSALAAMRLGAAYVSIDATWPDQRISHIVRDSGADFLVSSSSIFERLALPLTHVDPAEFGSEGKSAAAPPVTLLPDALAYLIYTSGSSGVPKGVEVTHANLSNLVRWHLRAFEIVSDDVGSHLAGMGFDAVGWEVWPYLCAGACVDLAEDEIVCRSAPMLQAWLYSRGISVAFVPTSLASQMIDMEWPSDTKLRTMLTGADTLFRVPKAGLPFTLINNYGPTECTVVATSCEVKAASDVPPPIGWPIDGSSIYVLDDEGRRCDPGVGGELYIGGAGVSRGYRNLPELTAAHFLPDLFSRHPGARMYRTGDLGVQLPDGQIAFRGRIDRQIKIRGLRIELDEISTLINAHPDVRFATVEKSSEEGQTTLTAYVLPVAEAELTATELRSFLAESLPRTMLPAQFVHLDHIPLSSSGKLDRAALPPATTETLLPDAVGKGPRTALEADLLTMVRELLRSEQVWVDDDFFLVGGHSLLGTQLVLRVRDAFQLELTLRHLFEAPTVELLALKVEAMLIAELQDLTEEEALSQVEGDCA